MRLSSVVALIAILPTSLVAQGYGGGLGGGLGGRGNRPDYSLGQQSNRNQIPKFATAKELERFNAADALLNEQRKLKLTDEQVTQLTALRATLFEKNADVLVRYDALRRDFVIPKALENNPPSSAVPPTREELAALGQRMRAMIDVFEELKARRPQQDSLVLAVVEASQKERASKALRDQMDDLRKQVPEKPADRKR